MDISNSSEETQEFSLYDWQVSAPVWGLEDVARGRTPATACTIYTLRNRNRSGVMGLLHPSGEFINKRGSSTGWTVRGKNPEGEHYEAEIVWDGAQKSPMSKVPIGSLDEEGVKSIYRESSKGLLLGDYTNTGALWAGIAAGRRMQ